MPIDSIGIIFLGTAAGKPSTTRNVSSLAVRLDSKLWVFDVGEGTQHRFIDPRCKLSLSKVSRIFITHMHGELSDHINGLPGLLCTISAGEGSVLPGESDPRLDNAQQNPPTEIYGPAGLRLFLRTTLTLTASILSRPYVVHELLFPGEETSTGELHPSERKGRDIRMGEDGFWRDLVSETEGGSVSVGAGPILHTINCIGYFLSEAPRPLPIQPSLFIPHLRNPTNAAALAAEGIKNPLSLLSLIQTERKSVTLADGTVLEPPALDPNGGRKIVILGDTYDASAMLPLVNPDNDDLVDVVVHEATNAFLPDLDDSQHPSKLRDGKPTTLESVTETACSHGHSTPQGAATFARRAGARTLLLNHLSVKYADADADEAERAMGPESREKARAMVREIERHADDVLRGGSSGEGERRVWAARDFWEFDVVRRDKRAKEKGKRT
ncbi:hypothetical protein JCM10295v2_004497 [Rhodotorula toruloides]